MVLFDLVYVFRGEIEDLETEYQQKRACVNLKGIEYIGMTADAGEHSFLHTTTDTRNTFELERKRFNALYRATGWTLELAEDDF